VEEGARFRRGFHDNKSDGRAKRLLIVMQKKWLRLRIYSKGWRGVQSIGSTRSWHWILMYSSPTYWWNDEWNMSVLCDSKHQFSPVLLLVTTADSYHHHYTYTGHVERGRVCGNGLNVRGPFLANASFFGLTGVLYALLACTVRFLWTIVSFTCCN
jgi:hypothetical protein